MRHRLPTVLYPPLRLAGPVPLHGQDVICLTHSRLIATALRLCEGASRAVASLLLHPQHAIGETQPEVVGTSQGGIAEPLKALLMLQEQVQGFRKMP